MSRAGTLMEEINPQPDKLAAYAPIQDLSYGFMTGARVSIEKVEGLMTIVKERSDVTQNCARTVAKVPKGSQLLIDDEIRTRDNWKQRQRQ